MPAPIGGVLSELAVREGMTVGPGTMLARINGLSTVWAQAEVPKASRHSVVPVQESRRSAATPGETFVGTVQAIVPEVNTATRTLKARVELANCRPSGLGMFVTMQFMDPRGVKSLLIPTEAVILRPHTHRRDAGRRQRDVSAG